jgi:pentose-5-phosphate-3-epimerase
MIVTPALLEQQVEIQKNQLISLSQYYSRFQIDIADNTLVPNTTTQISELSESAFFNLAKSAQFDFHLMVSNPMQHIDQIKLLPKKRVGTILIHYSVFPGYELLKKQHPLFKFGLVLDPKDEVQDLDEEMLKLLPSIQVMTIVPGFQGTPFIEKLLTKIEQLRKRGYKGEILIDGSVNEKTIPIILSKKVTPDVLGIGSYLTKSPSNMLKKRVSFLQSQISPLSKE